VNRWASTLYLSIGAVAIVAMALGPAGLAPLVFTAIAVSGAVANYAYDGTTVEVPQPGINFLIPVNTLRPLLEKAGN
jgi:hypothetical protein